jgi:hypothetical protein
VGRVGPSKSGPISKPIIVRFGVRYLTL